MDKCTDDLPLDTRLLSEAIIELNISRHNVSIYPRNHPIVEKSIHQVFSLLQKLFEMRSQVTLATAKDTLIIDSYFLDKQNPVYKDFAQCLNKKNIASVTFIKGLTKDELYTFHNFISEDTRDTISEDVQDLFRKHNIFHIHVSSVDFSAFKLVEGTAPQEDKEISLWEKYVFGLLEGRLRSEDAFDVIGEIPPDKLAGLVNSADLNNFKEESYERVIASYVRTSSEKAFSAKELKKILDFIDALRPEIKRHFLSSAVSTLSKDLDSVKESLKDLSVDSAMDLLSIINEQLITIPEALKNVLDQFSRLQHDSLEAVCYKEGLIEDDIWLSPEITNFLSDADFKAFVTDSYQQEIKRIIEFDAREINTGWIHEFESEWSNEYIEKAFHQVILEISFADGSGIIPKDEYDFFFNILREQTEYFIDTGQYKEVLETLRVFKAKASMGECPEVVSNIIQYFHSTEFFSLLVNSFRVMERDKREDVIQFCEYYGEKIIPPLMEALKEEESQSTRRFIVSLMTRFNEKVIPEAIKHLNDSRWFVKRNMLFILNECDSSNEESLRMVRGHCNHENPQVSFEAIKYLLKCKDSYGIHALKDYLRSDSKVLQKKAIALSGTFRVEDVVPDLIQLLQKKTISGSDFEDKIYVVRALGQIGDPSALDALRNILSTKTFLFRNSLDKLKKEICSTLKNYPHEEVKDLLRKCE